LPMRARGCGNISYKYSLAIFFPPSIYNLNTLRPRILWADIVWIFCEVMKPYSRLSALLSGIIMK